MRKFIGAAALLVSIGVPVAAQAALNQLTSLFVFGDSLSDGGNSGLASQIFAGPAAVYPPAPYFNGQYSNGPTAVEYLWNSFNPGNTSFKPSLAGGTNYAIGGATTGLENFNVVNPSVPPALQPAYNQLGNAWQLGTFVGQAPSFNPATSLFVVWMFPNDVFYQNTTGNLPGTASGGPAVPGGPIELVGNGINNIVSTVAFLASQGAQNFLVPNMPDLGAAPAFLGTPQAPDLSFLTGAFNQNLALALNQLGAALPGINLVQFDTAAAFADLLANPANYGFDVTNSACLDGLTQKAQCNPETWVFWDGVHPTTAAHAVIGEQFRAALVPEPQSYALMVLGLAGIGFVARRRRTAA